MALSFQHFSMILAVGSGLFVWTPDARAQSGSGSHRAAQLIQLKRMPTSAQKRFLLKRAIDENNEALKAELRSERSKGVDKNADLYSLYGRSEHNAQMNAITEAATVLHLESQFGQCVQGNRDPEWFRKQSRVRRVLDAAAQYSAWDEGYLVPQRTVLVPDSGCHRETPLWSAGSSLSRLFETAQFAVKKGQVKSVEGFSAAVQERAVINALKTQATLLIQYQNKSEAEARIELEKTYQKTFGTSIKPVWLDRALRASQTERRSTEPMNASQWTKQVCSQLNELGYFEMPPQKLIRRNTDGSWFCGTETQQLQGRSEISFTVQKPDAACELLLNQKDQILGSLVRSGGPGVLLLSEKLVQRKTVQGREAFIPQFSCDGSSGRLPDNSVVWNSAVEDALQQTKKVLSQSQEAPAGARAAQAFLKKMAKSNPTAVAQALAEHPELQEYACEAVASLIEDDLDAKELESLASFGVLAGGAALMVTGVGAGAGAGLIFWSSAALTSADLLYRGSEIYDSKQQASLLAEQVFQNPQIVDAIFDQQKRGDQNEIGVLDVFGGAVEGLDVAKVLMRGYIAARGVQVAKNYREYIRQGFEKYGSAGSRSADQVLAELEQVKNLPPQAIEPEVRAIQQAIREPQDRPKGVEQLLQGRLLSPKLAEEYRKKNIIRFPGQKPKDPKYLAHIQKDSNLNQKFRSGTAAELATKLKKAPVSMVMDLSSGVNKSFLVRYENGAVGVFKPQLSSEQKKFLFQEDIPYGDSKNEAIAVALDRMLGMNLHPNSAYVELEFGGTRQKGFFSLFEPNTQPAYLVKAQNSSEAKFQKVETDLFDYLIENSDRNYTNILARSDGSLVPIDPGISFEDGVQYAKQKMEAEKKWIGDDEAQQGRTWMDRDLERDPVNWGVWDRDRILSNFGKTLGGAQDPSALKQYLDSDRGIAWIKKLEALDFQKFETQTRALGLDLTKDELKHYYEFVSERRDRLLKDLKRPKLPAS